QHWPPPRRESLTIGSTPVWTQPSSAMDSYNIAIIGAIGVGKSTFVQRILGLSRPPISTASSVRISVDSASYMITLLELDLDSFELNTPQPIQWPKQINGHIVPRVDAALVLYDVTNQDTIRELPQTLAALTNSNMPAMLVATKCEAPQEDRQVDPDDLANHALFRSCLAHFKISSTSPEIDRGCLHAILKAAVSHRRGTSSYADEIGEMGAARKRAQSAANLEATDPSAARPVSEGRHNRASSDFSLLRGFAAPSVGTPVADGHVQKQASRSPHRGYSGKLTATPIPLIPLSIDGRSCGSSADICPPLGGRGTDSYLDADESDTDSRRYSDDIPILQRSDDAVVEKQQKMAGVPFDELVDRLLALRLSRADLNFSDVFLCLYRKFAAPGELFSAILMRLDRVRDDKTAHHLTKTATQLRIIETVAKWVSLYPGDFARLATRRNLDEFIRYLSTEPIFCIAARQMHRNLTLHVIEDDDTGWANADDADDQLASDILSKELSELPAGLTALQFGDEDSNFDRPSVSSENLNRVVGSGGQIQLYSYEDYEREAATLDPTDHLPMNKFRYRIFVEIKDDEIADELTRIDWIMFSSIRIRDFVRHVSLGASQKESCKSLNNVNRMINHFNHVAKWVANMILLRDKAKHRALVLEKFMNIALKLRQLNNYNGLAAVLAGINGTAIHRLSQTKALVSPETHKKFARLVILMGTQKSHFAYRLAWENSPLPRIPFMPLHRRDLVSAEEGSKTFVGPNGDRINWKKFEVLGEVLLPLMKSQGSPYPNLSKNDNVRELILGCHMTTDEEEIYQRSLEVEGSSSGGGGLEPTKKIFPWLNLQRQGTDAMRLASVNLPKLHLASHEQRLDFSLEGSLQLRFPNGTKLPKTSSDLLKLAKEKHLWIARTGSCYFQLDVSVQGEPVSEEDHVAKLVEWVRDCEVWNRAGITLHDQERGVGEPMGRIAFSIQHPDLSSALVTRGDALTAEFESVTCRVNFTLIQDEPSKKKKRSLKRKRERWPDESIEGNQLDGVSCDDDYLACLSPDDQRAIDEFIQSLQMVPHKPGTNRSTPKAAQGAQALEFSDLFRPLFEAALEVLVLGSAKKHKGVTTVDCNRAECLTQLAPAVFNMSYLKVISDRAALLPTIATSLARMNNAESPSLRQKAASFAARVADQKCGQYDRVVRGIEKSAWHVLLSTVK
ncbi:RasGEF protein, partial [Trichoderma reesei QM6a]